MYHSDMRQIMAIFGQFLILILTLTFDLKMTLKIFVHEKDKHMNKQIMQYKIYLLFVMIRIILPPKLT